MKTYAMSFGDQKLWNGQTSGQRNWKSESDHWIKEWKEKA